MNGLLEKHNETFEAKTKERDALLAKGDAITQEDLATVKKLNGELKGIQTQILDLKSIAGDVEELRKFAKDPVLTLDLGKGPVTVAGVTKAGTTEIDVNKNGIDFYDEGYGLLTEKQAKAVADPDYKRAWAKMIRMKGDFDQLDSIERKTLQTGIDDEGGFLAPDEILNRLIMKAPAPTRVNGRVMQLQTGSKALVMPNVQYSTDDIYSTGIRATLTGEIPASSTAHRVTDPVFGQTRIEIGTWMLSMPLTLDLIEDSGFPLIGWSTQRFAETIDLLRDNQALNGTGVGVNPHGILKNPGGTNEPAVVLSSTANDIDADQIRGIPFNVPEQYINDNTCWVMNRANCGKGVALLKDGENRYLFSRGGVFPGIADRVPDTLDGDPLVYSAFMPDRGDGKYPMIYGDLHGYYMATRVGFSIRVLNEINAQDNQVVLLGRLRFGGKVAEPWRMVIGKSDNA